MIELLMAMEALASCQIEGLATGVTLTDYLVAKIDAERKAELRANRDARYALTQAGFDYLAARERTQVLQPRFTVAEFEVLRQALAAGLNDGIFDSVDKKIARQLIDRVRAVVRANAPAPLEPAGRAAVPGDVVLHRLRGAGKDAAHTTPEDVQRDDRDDADERQNERRLD